MYTATANEEARVGLYCLEVACTSGTGKLRTPTGLDKALKESLNRAFSYLQSIKERTQRNPGIERYLR